MYIKEFEEDPKTIKLINKNYLKYNVALYCTRGRVSQTLRISECNREIQEQ